LAMKEENASETEAQLPVRQHPLAFELKSWLRDIVFAFAIAIFIVVFVVQPVKVEGTSMQPQLVDQERIFVNRFIYKFSDIHRSDVVVFWYPKDRTKSFIKRIVGVP
jgi:signal peptidase I